MMDFQTMFSLQGKKALISGGLGSAIAEAFLRQGAQVAVCGGHPQKHSLCWSLPKRLVKKHFPSAATSLLRDRSIPFWSRWNNRWEAWIFWSTVPESTG